MPGPRYLIPALPFIALGVARFREHLPWLADRLLVISVLAMALPTLAMHLVPDGGATVVSHIRNIRDGGLAESVFTVLLGPFGWLLHAAILGGALWNLARVRSDPRRTFVREVASADSL